MLLDTCALLWLAMDDPALSNAARKAIDAAPIVHISAITGFEIALKARSGKLELPVPPGEWLEAVTEHHDLSVIPVDLAVCVAAAGLPLIHKDPCDRFIIATARIHKLSVATTDAVFKEYGVHVVA